MDVIEKLESIIKQCGNRTGQYETDGVELTLFWSNSQQKFFLSSPSCSGSRFNRFMVDGETLSEAIEKVKV